MPTKCGVPITPGVPGYIGPLNPVNWLDICGQEVLGVQQSAVMRGQPAPFSWWQRRREQGPQTTAQPGPFYLHSRPYSRGAPAFAPKFGTLNINPIGAGVYAPYRIPTIAGPGARYAFAAIWFDVQTIPTSLRVAPTVPVESVAALLAQSHVGASYRTTG